jgi:Pyruvate/2-oxoacid:ferredoxin oxidoreductase gamma subunit
MLGAFAKATGLVTLGSLKAAISQRFGEKAGEQNFRAAERAYNETVAV